jgi:hypothetical protein
MAIAGYTRAEAVCFLQRDVFIKRSGLDWLPAIVHWGRPHEVNGRKFEEMIVYDGDTKTKRASVFMQPDWKGVCPDTIAQARTVAGPDYVVLTSLGTVAAFKC